ncbi:MAG: hypothetical protein ABSE73_29845, partial [Planctomycetota bacterium]
MRHLICVVPFLACLLAAAERPAVRLLYDFEDPAEATELSARAENATFDIVQDNGVTHGRTCARAVFEQGVDFAVFELGRDKIKDWAGYDYVAFDI